MLLLVLGFGYMLLEALSYARMSRGSGRGHRMATESREAVHLKPTSPDGKPTVLLVGNSLLREAVDMDQLKGALGDRYDFHRLIVESTYYNDWRYAIPALFERGARPSVLVITLSPAQMNGATPVSMETTHYLLNTKQVMALAHSDGSGLSGYVSHFIEHFSPLWGTRNSTQVAFKSFIPGYRSTVFTIANEPPAPQQFDHARLAALATICRQYNVKLVYLATPANDPNGEKDAAQLQQAAAENNVPYLRPVRDDFIPSAQYVDDYHLDKPARNIFLPKLLAQLPAALDASIAQPR